MANGRVFFILDGGAGELARHEVRVVSSDGEHEAFDYAPLLIDWLQREHIVLTQGDTISIVWQED